jgi:threonine/homoserine/homoserine lactone efflux protein
MPTPSTIAAFALASLALAVVPGPAVTYVVAQSVDKGRQAGLTSALGVSGGGIVHVAAATLGLSALIASSAPAFTVVKLVGAVYLVVVGIRRILTRHDSTADSEPAPLQRVWAQGVVVNVLNPKTALFFLALLPQFVERARGPVWTQIAFLGGLYVVIALSTDATYALLAGGLARRLRGSERGAVVRRFATGGIFVALGVAAAAAQRS